MFFFLFVIYLDESASIRIKSLMRSKEFNCFSRFVLQAKVVCRTQAATGYDALSAANVLDQQ
jgi:hypothetical protein